MTDCHAVRLEPKRLMGYGSNTDAGSVVVLVSGDRDLEDGYGYLNIPSQRVHRVDRVWACDNGAFSGFDENRWERMLSQLPIKEALFVTMPDVVSDWSATRKLWLKWAPLYRGRCRMAVVAQDGMTPRDIPMDAGAVFIGGSTGFKLGTAAADIIAYARARGLWVHMGRVNSKRRLLYAESIGVQSIDGTSWSRFPDVMRSRAKAWKGTDDGAIQRCLWN
jgi:hypothetical protein